MARVWTTPIKPMGVVDAAQDAVTNARRVSPAAVREWRRRHDQETSEFIDYWFATKQQRELERLAIVLPAFDGPVGDALRLALSSIIVTKESGASLARDTSHSRPHRVRMENPYGVLAGFSKAAERIAKKLEKAPPRTAADVRLGDARDLNGIRSRSVDAAVTSPPYLNAIDYLRGHRLALVWLGWSLRDLRQIRAESIGTERMADNADPAQIEQLTASMGNLEALPPRFEAIIYRYCLDMLSVVRELHRVLRPDGFATFVVGNSSLRGTFVRNDALIAAAAAMSGFELVSQVERDLPSNRRYLPPPKTTKTQQLDSRMATETILTLRRI